MKKFLALLEELDPTTQGHPKWDLLDFLKSKGINASGVKGTDTIYIDTGEKNIAITVANTEEDAESMDGDYNVNDDVENLAGKSEGGLKGMAGKVLGSTAQQAAGAIKKRQQVSRQAVGVYDRKTQQLQKDLANV